MPELLLLGLFAAVIGAAAAFGPDTRDPRYRLVDPRAGRSTPPDGAPTAGSDGSPQCTGGAEMPSARHGHGHGHGHGPGVGVGGDVGRRPRTPGAEGVGGPVDIA